MILSSCWGTEVLQYEKPRSPNSPSHHESVLLVTQTINECLGEGYYFCTKEDREYKTLLYVPEADRFRRRTECADVLMENFYLKCTSNCKIIESKNCRLLISELDVQERDLQDDGYAGIEHTLQYLDNMEQDKGKAPRNIHSRSGSRYHPYKRYIYFNIVRLDETIPVLGDLQSINHTFSLERTPSNSMNEGVVQLLAGGKTIGYVDSQDVSRFDGIDLQGKIPKIVNKGRLDDVYLMKVKV